MESPGKAPLFVPRFRGSLDFARDDVLFFTEKGTREDVVYLVVISTKRSAWRDPLRRSGTLLRVDTRVDINPLQDFRYTLKRSIYSTTLDMP